MGHAVLSERPVKIIALGGSLDGGLSTRHALNQVLAGAQAAGAEVALLDISALDLPLYVHGQAPVAGAMELITAVRAADGLVWGSPLYHGSVSGAFKNAIDWMELLGRDQPPYLTDKIVALVATAGGAQAMQAINAMEQIVRALRGLTLPLVVPIERAHLAFEPGGAPQDAKLAELLFRQGAELVRLASKLRGGR
jgi:FMN reductase